MAWNYTIEIISRKGCECAIPLIWLLKICQPSVEGYIQVNILMFTL